MGFRSEINENKYLFNNQGTNVDERFEVCLRWYVRKACRYKNIFYWCTFLAGACPLAVTAVNCFDFLDKPGILKGVTAVLSMVAGISVVILNMTRAQEKWTNYRGAAEHLKRVRAEFLMEKDVMGKGNPQFYEEYFKSLEKYMADEHELWEQLNKGTEGKQSLATSSSNISERGQCGEKNEIQQAQAKGQNEQNQDSQSIEENSSKEESDGSEEESMEDG